MVGYVIPGVAIGALFLMARRAAREATIADYRARTMEVESFRRAALESASQGEILDRMRSISNAQMTALMTGSNIPAGIMVPRSSGVSGPSVSPFVPQLVASPSMIMR